MNIISKLKFCFLVVILLFSWSCTAFSEETEIWAEWSPEYYNAKPEELLSVIFPGATFIDCGKIAEPTKCLNNRNEMVSALRKLNKINYMYFGKELDKNNDQVVRFLEEGFWDISICFKYNCNSSINSAEEKSEFYYKSWNSLGRYLYCRYVFLSALKRVLPDISRTYAEKYRLNLYSRDECLVNDFPQHLFNYVNKTHHVFGHDRF